MKAAAVKILSVLCVLWGKVWWLKQLSKNNFFATLPRRLEFSWSGYGPEYFKNKMFFYGYTSNRKTPKYKTPAFVKNPRSVQELNVHEKKRLSFDCHEESNDARAKQSQAVSPGQGENIEENLRECLKQLEEVREKGIFSFVTNNIYVWYGGPVFSLYVPRRKDLCRLGLRTIYQSLSRLWNMTMKAHFCATNMQIKRLVGKFKIYATGTWNYPAQTDQFYLKMSSNTGLWNPLFHRPAIC